MLAKKHNPSPYDMISDATAVWNGGAHALAYERMKRVLSVADHGTPAFQEAESMLRIFEDAIEDEIESLNRRLLALRKAIIR